MGICHGGGITAKKFVNTMILVILVILIIFFDFGDGFQIGSKINTSVDGIL